MVADPSRAKISESSSLFNYLRTEWQNDREYSGVITRNQPGIAKLMVANWPSHALRSFGGRHSRYFSFHPSHG